MAAAGLSIISIDVSRDVNETAAIVLGAKRSGGKSAASDKMVALTRFPDARIRCVYGMSEILPVAIADVSHYVRPGTPLAPREQVVPLADDGAVDDLGVRGVLKVDQGVGGEGLDVGGGGALNPEAAELNVAG